MLKTKSKPVEIGTKLYDPNDVIKDGLEEELDSYTRSAVSKIRFKLIIKPAMISFIALIVSFFLDVSAVPFFGNVTFDLAKSFSRDGNHQQQHLNHTLFGGCLLFLMVSFYSLRLYSYSKLKIEIIRTPATETIDRLIQAATSVIDSIATALPLIGAAILLVSIPLGEEIFLGISIPFEIKALIVLAIGKLFEPVLDQLGVEFQNVVNHVKDIREKYFSRIQIENSKAMLKQMSPQALGSAKAQMTVEEMAQYKNLVEHTAKLSSVMLKNFASIQEILDKLSTSQPISSENLREMSSLAESITKASDSLTDERTLAGLKHLEAIVKK